MKTTTVARGFIGAVASLLGVVAVGCSADVMDQGAAGEGEIGRTEQALVDIAGGTFDNITAAAINPRVNAPRSFAASCVLHDSTAGKDYMLIAGGLSAAGTVTNNWYLFDASGASGNAPSTQFIKSGTFSTARSHAKMIQLDSDTCLMSGGLNGSGNAVTTDTSIKFDLSYVSSVLTITPSGVSALNSARGKHAMLPCGTGKAIAIGGVKTSGTTVLNSTNDKTIEIFDGSVWRVAANGNPAVTAQLVDERYDFGVIKDSAGDNYMVAGGNDGTTSLDTLEIINVANACDYTQAINTKVANTGTAGQVLSEPVEGNVLIPEGHTDTVLSAAGDIGGLTPLRTTTDVIDVDWFTPTNTTVAAGGPALPTGTWLPTLVAVPDAPNKKHFVLVGGGNGVAPTAGIDSVQDFSFTAGNTGTWDHETAHASFTARFGLVAEHLPSRDLAAGGGQPLRKFIYAAGGQTTNVAFSSLVEDIRIFE